MRISDKEALLKLMCERYDDSQAYDWDNPYKDDLRALAKHHHKIDRESGRMDKSSDFSRAVKNREIEDKMKSDGRKISDMIEDISYSLETLLPQIMELETKFKKGDDSEETYEDLQVIAQELDEIDKIEYKLSKIEGGGEALYDYFEDPERGGYVAGTVKKAKNFLHELPHIYSGPPQHYRILSYL